ncbi:glycosyl hydrolase 115 family protein [Caulobacter soli]|uniref:glycosyl hydrolase 115 family protein n=1 Tax=Caulobacter soli TaxID=2708539 RepID=UPI0013EB755B|nr:glycosyl hydrolase 115 family protein [Caulobacter soli]
MIRTAASALALAAALAVGVAIAAPARASEPVAISAAPAAGAFPLIANARSARIETDVTDWPGVLRAVNDIRSDLSKLSADAQPAEDAPVVIIGTIGKSAAIDALIASGKLDVTGVNGQWEAFVQQVVENPRPGVARALVIAGADKRGTIFGAYDLIERAGVSPWSWWADVPVSTKAQIYVAAGRRVQKPTVKYRGLFLNDEDPALSGWAKARFGGVNHDFYAKVFELTLRLKGNFLWPAMWGKSIYDDDPLSAPLADEYGVVLGTSHHEPLGRAHVEWDRYGQGPWDYTKNPEKLRDFWREGVKRLGANESLVTVGMRGDGDEPMTQGTATKLLETIVADQRQIIGEVTGKPASETPQVWALYKEVQDYYDAGMRVPDDVTLLFSDDNWGDIRRLPEPGKTRPGGYGVYYHFDYVGGPRNYKWVNTNQVSRTWEQMKLARDYGADRLWIVNVGDLKPMELPIEFFLDMAWDPDAMSVGKMAGFTHNWAAAQFGAEHADEIAALLDGYTRLNARRKPELIDGSTFSLVNFREAERVEGEWADLERRADAIRRVLPKDQDDAFFQLVWFPIQASANHTRLYIAAGRNALYAKQGRVAANDEAAKVRALFARDGELVRQWDEDLAGGKWDKMMSQTHIGYTYWQQPPTNVIPATSAVRAGAGWGVAVEGRADAVADAADLPPLARDGAASRWIDVFNRGVAPLAFNAKAGEPWVKVSPGPAAANGDTRLEISVDWKAAPAGARRVPITLTGADGKAVTVTAVVEDASRKAAKGAFVEAGGPLAIEAEHHVAATGAGGVSWTTIPGLGRTLSGVTSSPSTAPSSAPGQGAWLDYAVDLEQAGDFDLRVFTAPSLDFRGGTGLRYAVSLDGAPPVIANLHEGETHTGEGQKSWEKAVADNARVQTIRLTAAKAGAHRIRLWRVDPGVVFERLVISRGDLPENYLGPVEGVRH